MPLRWDPKQFKKELLQQVARNGQQVGEFVRADARRRLLSISDPYWGKEYRSYVAGRVSYEIETLPNEVVIEVGVRGGYSQYHGFYIEVGTELRPAAPWLRPAVFENKRQIVELVNEGLEE